MKPPFASREFPFLKTDSDTELAGPPAIYLSDLVDFPTTESTAFIRRLNTAAIPETGFVCSVIRVGEPLCQSDRDKISDCLESTFQWVFQAAPQKIPSNPSDEKSQNHVRRGIWETLNQKTFALAFWDYEDKEQADNLLESLKKNLGTALGKGILMGRAWYPCKEFSVSQTFYNAIKALDHAAFFNDNHLQDFDAVSLNISGDRKYQLGQYEAAVKEYEAGLLMDAHNINLLNSLGVCFGITNKLEQAREQFQNALDLMPEDIMVLYNMGLIHHIQDNEDTAIVYLKKAHAIHAGIYEVELLLGQLLHKTGQDDTAVSHLETAANLKPEASAPLRLQGEIFLAQSNPRKAGQIFNRAVKRNAQDAGALSGYALSMAEQGKNIQIAVTFARKSLAMDPENMLFAQRLSRILHLQEQQTNKQSKLA